MAAQAALDTLNKEITAQNAPKEGKAWYDCKHPKKADGTVDLDESGKAKPRPVCDEAGGLCCGLTKKPDTDDSTMLEVCHESKNTMIEY